MEEDRRSVGPDTFEDAEHLAEGGAEQPVRGESRVALPALGKKIDTGAFVKKMHKPSALFEGVAGSKQVLFSASTAIAAGFKGGRQSCACRRRGLRGENHLHSFMKTGEMHDGEDHFLRECTNFFQ